MKRSLLLSLAFLLGLPLCSAQIFFEEDFESGSLPAGWSVQSSATDGGWNVGAAGALSSQAFSILPNGSANIAATNDDKCNCNKRHEYLITPAIDLSDATAAVLRFDLFYIDNAYQGAQEDATVEVSLDGSDWTVLEDLHGHASWDRHSINLSDYVGNETVYIGFRYDDNFGWLYGCAVDNIVVEVPADLDVALVESGVLRVGEVGRAMPIKATVYNEGVSTINTLEVTYTVNGGSPVVETLDGLDIEGFEHYEFELPNPWMPDGAGVFDIDIEISAVNGMVDAVAGNNSGSLSSEIFEPVNVENKVMEMLEKGIDPIELVEAAQFLNKPTDLDFFPVLGKNELWITSQRTENEGGSTLTIEGATKENPDNFWMRVDGNAWHFMSLPTGISFSDDNLNFATSPGVQDANHSGGTFTGPTLWSSDPVIYAQPSGGNGSHLDMLHGTPYGMGITHEVDNVFWVYDNWNKDIVRYDFVDDHGPGNDYHADALVRRFRNIGINSSNAIPSHLILDKNSGWLYFVDNANQRVMRLDINSGTGSQPLALINEDLTEHSEITGFVVETIIETDLVSPSGIELFENYLLVGDYSDGKVHVYDVQNDFEKLGTLSTGNPGLAGIKIGPDGNLWYVNHALNQLFRAEPSISTSTRDQIEDGTINVFPNPSNGEVFIDVPDDLYNEATTLIIRNMAGQVITRAPMTTNNQRFEIPAISSGIYLLEIQSDTWFYSQKLQVIK